MRTLQNSLRTLLCVLFVWGSFQTSTAWSASKKKKSATPALTAVQILKRMDQNQVFGTRRAFITMRIKKRGVVRTKKMESVSRGEKTSFSKFLYPARDKGVKYLRMGDNLWMYLPNAEKTIKISGHMLRQSMMGSDFSYEDMLNNNALTDVYNVKMIKREKVGKHDCYVLHLKQKKRGQTYPIRKIWVDSKLFVPRRSDMFALSGRLMKTMRFGKVKQYGKRYYTTYMKMENKLRRGTWTEVVLTKLIFKVKLAGQIFSLQNLQSED